MRGGVRFRPPPLFALPADCRCPSPRRNALAGTWLYLVDCKEALGSLFPFPFLLSPSPLRSKWRVAHAARGSSCPLGQVAVVRGEHGEGWPCERRSSGARPAPPSASALCGRDKRTEGKAGPVKFGVFFAKSSRTIPRIAG